MYVIGKDIPSVSLRELNVLEDEELEGKSSTAGIAVLQMSSPPTFAWAPLQSDKFGLQHRAIAMVEIKNPQGDWKIFYPEVDSGAIISVFSESDCRRLGMELKNDDDFVLRGVLGDSCPAYVHRVELKIGNLELRPRIAFTEGRKHKALLGRLDVFEKFKITFRQRLLQTEFQTE